MICFGRCLMKEISFQAIIFFREIHVLNENGLLPYELNLQLHLKLRFDAFY